MVIVVAAVVMTVVAMVVAAVMVVVCAMEGVEPKALMVSKEGGKRDFKKKGCTHLSAALTRAFR